MDPKNQNASARTRNAQPGKPAQTDGGKPQPETTGKGEGQPVTQPQPATVGASDHATRVRVRAGLLSTLKYPRFHKGAWIRNVSGSASITLERAKGADGQPGAVETVTVARKSKPEDSTAPDDKRGPALRDGWVGLVLSAPDIQSAYGCSPETFAAIVADTVMGLDLTVQGAESAPTVDPMQTVADGLVAHVSGIGRKGVTVDTLPLWIGAARAYGEHARAKGGVSPALRTALTEALRKAKPGAMVPALPIPGNTLQPVPVADALAALVDALGLGAESKPETSDKPAPAPETIAGAIGALQETEGAIAFAGAIEDARARGVKAVAGV